MASGVGVEQLMGNLHRRTEHSEAASAANASMYVSHVCIHACILAHADRHTIHIRHIQLATESHAYLFNYTIHLLWVVLTARRSSGSSMTDLKQEMLEMKAQLLEMKQLMRLSFDLQLDIQRSIRQEVAAAFSTQCQPSSGTKSMQSLLL